MKLSKNNRTEKELVLRCRDNDRFAWQELYDKYAPKMYAIVVRYVKDSVVAQDLLQDGFVKVFTKIDTLKDVVNLEAWLRVIFVNTALSYLRDKKLKNVVFEDMTLYDNNIDTDVGIDISKIDSKDIMQYICMLPDKYRTVMNLYAIEGYSYKEIAKMLNIKNNTARGHYFRAKKMLYDMLKKDL